MSTEDGLVEFRRVVCSDAVNKVFHVLRLSIAGLFPRIQKFVSRVENLVAAIGFDFHITFGAIERNERAWGMLRARDALIGNLLPTLELP